MINTQNCFSFRIKPRFRNNESKRFYDHMFYYVVSSKKRLPSMWLTHTTCQCCFLRVAISGFINLSPLSLIHITSHHNHLENHLLRLLESKIDRFDASITYLATSSRNLPKTCHHIRSFDFIIPINVLLCEMRILGNGKDFLLCSMMMTLCMIWCLFAKNLRWRWK